MKKLSKRRTVADSVANVGESGDRDRCLGTSVSYLAPRYLADAGNARLPVVCSHHSIIRDPMALWTNNADSAGLTRSRSDAG